MRFEWDPAKAESNRKKHKVAFSLAQKVWDDPLHVIVPDRMVDGEERFHAIGNVHGVVVLVVVHSNPDPGDEELIRIISARKATAAERRRYEDEA